MQDDAFVREYQALEEEFAVDGDTLLLELSKLMGEPEAVVIRQGMLALIEKELRLAEEEIAQIRRRYDVLSKESLLEAIQAGMIPGHPAWEDYIVWKNKEHHIARLRQLVDSTWL
jgi:ABC-type phosphate/phosphonate transport system ATPase subunit